MPQVFVGGQHLGGCTDVVEACESGRLAEVFREAGVAFDAGKRVDAWGFLPKWIHPRKSA